MPISAISTCSAVSSRPCAGIQLLNNYCDENSLYWIPAQGRDDTPWISRLFLKAFISTLCLLISAPAFASAWVQKQGHGEFIANATYFTTDEFYTRNGDSASQTRFDKFELQPYLEYGVTKSITVGGSFFMQHVAQGEQHNSGIGDPEIFLRKQLYRDDKNVFSLQPLVKFPSTYSRGSQLRGGSPSTDAEISLFYGRNLNLVSNRDYGDFRIGYRTRSDDLSDQIRADAVLGLRITNNWEIMPAIRYVKASSLGSATAFSENGEQNYDLLKAELGANYYVSDRRSIRANLFSHVAGRQIGGGHGASIGYAVKF